MYCLGVCFTGTTCTLSTIVFTVITLVCWLAIVWASYMPSYVSIIMYRLRLFSCCFNQIVLTQKSLLERLSRLLWCSLKSKYVYTMFWSLCEWVTWPSCSYCNVWFIVVLQELHCYWIVYICIWSKRQVAITSPSFFDLHLLVSEIAKCIAWGCMLYCCFTRTTLFTATFRVYSMCIPSLALIYYYELHGHLCPYCNVWPEIVYCCFTENYTVYWIVYMFVWSEVEVCYHFTKFRCSTPSSFWNS